MPSIHTAVLRKALCLFLFSSLIPCVSCGNPNSCKELCKAVKPFIEEQLQISLVCNNPRWTEQTSCGACLWILAGDYGVELGNAKEMCQQHFGGTGELCADVTCSDHGVCQATGALPRCLCDDGYFPKQVECLPDS